jgi:putative NIF3 family GTP cyclohydrolase 1 type 2/RimJ/RimL family protein N-acetyltransferase
MVTARQVSQHLKQIGPWVNWSGGTCDGFKFGDPDTVITGIAIGWQALQSTLEEAERKACNLFITHEPTFYNHMDNDQAALALPAAQHKMAWLSEHQMVVYRCHDVWDTYPRLGILDSWSEFLELGQPYAHSNYHNIHVVPNTTAWELALRIMRRVSALNEQSIQFQGVRWQMVHKLAVGTGAITDVRKMIEMGADVLLATDDGMSYWNAGALAADMGIPLIVVNHRTAEIPGLRKLAMYLQQEFQIPVEFVGSTCSFEVAAVEVSRETSIRMQLADLDHLPPLVLPEGYEFRPMRADEAWAYIAVMNRSDFMGECDQVWFNSTFVEDPQYDPSHLCLIWHDGQPVAAAGAWHCKIDGEDWGMIHWVGVIDSERGKGLGKAITLAALHRLKERGFTRAMLGTHPWRLQAIAAYLRLGFVPWPTARAPQTVWDEVLRNLDMWRKSR